MGQIIISFFAVVGITFLGFLAFEYFAYRKWSFDFPLVVDLRAHSPEEAIEILELIALVRMRKSGRTAISRLAIILPKEGPMMEDFVLRLLKDYDLPGCVYHTQSGLLTDVFSENADRV